MPRAPHCLESCSIASGAGDAPNVSAGGFVWCAFPESPGPLHVRYVLAVLPFTIEEAHRLGQSRAFVLDLRRLANLPLTPTWFSFPGSN